MQIFNNKLLCCLLFILQLQFYYNVLAMALHKQTDV